MRVRAPEFIKFVRSHDCSLARGLLTETRRRTGHPWATRVLGQTATDWRPFLGDCFHSSCLSSVLERSTTYLALVAPEALQVNTSVVVTSCTAMC